VATTKKAPETALYEVLVRKDNGHETVHRVQAADVEAAKTAVAEGLPRDQTVVEADLPGRGIGSRR
jgi:hypothetical protein